MQEINELTSNINDVRQRIEKAAVKSGRKPEDITLVAVTKTVDAEIINQALHLGIKDIGENKVQEIQNKYGLVKQEVNWHLIGHLQTNKVKYIIDKVQLIHSVDSFKLAEEINHRAKAIGKMMDILIQVNVSEEESKYGIKTTECEELIKAISALTNIKVRGLMTIAPYVSNPEGVRIYFRQLKNLSIDIGQKNYDNITMDYLSMGMTGDFEVAIEEGANIVRIGTAIFGRRKYT